MAGSLALSVKEGCYIWLREEKKQLQEEVAAKLSYCLFESILRSDLITGFF